MTLTTLIDKQDNSEIIRDQVSAILALETASQTALATLAGKPSPEEWTFRVFQERANQWECFPYNSTDIVPVVNVWVDNSVFIKSRSNSIERQGADLTLNIDCYAPGLTTLPTADTQISGDENAAIVAQRVARLVRNILMAAEYTYLGLRGTVGQRWIESITLFQPQQGNQTAHHTMGARLVLKITYNEFSPQYELETLELLTAEVSRTGDGEVVLNASYDYTV